MSATPFLCTHSNTDCCNPSLEVRRSNSDHESPTGERFHAVMNTDFLVVPLRLIDFRMYCCKLLHKVSKLLCDNPCTILNEDCPAECDQSTNTLISLLYLHLDLQPIPFLGQRLLNALRSAHMSPLN